MKLADIVKKVSILPTDVRTSLAEYCKQKADTASSVCAELAINYTLTNEDKTKSEVLRRKGEAEAYRDLYNLFKDK